MEAERHSEKVKWLGFSTSRSTTFETLTAYIRRLITFEIYQSKIFPSVPKDNKLCSVYVLPGGRNAHHDN